jgi:hypothetical protein
MTAGTAPSPPKFKKMNVQQTANDAIAADIAGYNWSDNDFLSRFPGLVQQRNDQIDNAYNQLNGPLDPTVQNSFVNQGVSQSLGSFGGGDPFATLGDTKTGAGANTVAKSVANSVQGKQDADRNYFDGLLASNPQRAIGPSGGDIANWYITNATGQNASNQAAYAGQVGNYNAQVGASNANTSAGIAAGVSILSAVIGAI